jgi:hypothetical protein
LLGESGRGFAAEGAVVAINGKWITVKHDKKSSRNYSSDEAPRFDYLAEDLEHINPLLRLVSEL